MPDPNESRPYNPYRADVDPKPLKQVSKQFKDLYFGSAVNSNLDFAASTEVRRWEEAEEEELPRPFRA